MLVVTFFTYLFLYLTILCTGYVIVSLFGVKNFIGRISLGVLLSTSLLTYVQFLLFALFKLKFTTVNLVGILLFCWILLFSQRNKLRLNTKTFKGFFQRLHLKKLEKALSIFLIVFILFRFISNLYLPLIDWDSLALYDFRAKVFAETGEMADGIRRGYFLHYPLYTSLLHTWSYLLGIPQVKTWYALLFTAFLGSFYFLLRKETSRTTALIGTVFLATNHLLLAHSSMGYTNLPYAIFLSIGFLFLLHWIQKGERSELLLGSVFIAFSTWIRLTEPFWILSLPLFALGFIRWKKDFIAILGSALFIIFLKYPWTSFAARATGNQAANPFFTFYTAKEADVRESVFLLRLKSVLFFFYHYVYPILRSYVPPLIIAFLFAVYKKNQKYLLNVCIFTFFVSFIILGIFLFSFQFPEWATIPDSATRMSMFLIPLAIYLIMTSELWYLNPQKIRRKE